MEDYGFPELNLVLFNSDDGVDVEARINRIWELAATHPNLLLAQNTFHDERYETLYHHLNGAKSIATNERYKVDFGYLLGCRRLISTTRRICLASCIEHNDDAFVYLINTGYRIYETMETYDSEENRDKQKALIVGGKFPVSPESARQKLSEMGEVGENWEVLDSCRFDEGPTTDYYYVMFLPRGRLNTNVCRFSHNITRYKFN